MTTIHFRKSRTTPRSKMSLIKVTPSYLPGLPVIRYFNWKPSATSLSLASSMFLAAS